MTAEARRLLDAVRADLAPRDEHNRLVPEIAAGRAPLAAIGALATEEMSIVPSDRRSFLTLAANAAWGSYCATLSVALRAEYGFGDEACAFVDFFATPAAELEELAIASIQQALDGGRPVGQGREYGRLLQEYELMFWNTLAG